MDYDKIAPYYQSISRRIFGNTLLECQLEVFRALKPYSKLLIIGGGDGTVFKHIERDDLEITFVEMSGKMMSLARKQTDLPINWVQNDIFGISFEETFDYVYLPFLIDNFTVNQTEDLIRRIRPILNQDGELIITDFVENPRGWHKYLMQTMYLFFRMVASVQVRKMPPLKSILKAEGFLAVSTQLYFKGFIETTKYKI